MILALFALAVLMIVGGSASVIQGFPFVRLESGLAMVIAGATTASAGAIVLAIATLTARVRGLARALADAADRPFSPGPPFDGSPREADIGQAGDGAPAVEVGSPGRRPSIVGLAGAGAVGAGAAGLALGRTQSEPTFHDDRPADPTPSNAEPFLPELPPLADEPGRDRAQEIAHDPIFDAPSPTAPVVAEPGTAARDQDEPVALRPSLEPEPSVEASHHDAPAEAERPAEPTAEDALAQDLIAQGPPAQETPALGPEATVVGTYASGGNTYVMYATGVIEADTPRGKFTFGSLDELKAFVEDGGEADARGAA